MNTVQPFNPHHISVIHHNGGKWITAEQLGLALGFSAKRARDGINNLYKRHADEFADGDSTTIKLMAVDGKVRETRVFSLSGCNLISFFANTAHAKAFRAWAKVKLAQEQPSSSSADSWLIAELQDQYLAARPDMARLLGYRLKGLNRAEIGILLNISPRTVGRRIKTLQQLHILPHTPQPELVTCLPAADIQASLALEG